MFLTTFLVSFSAAIALAAPTTDGFGEIELFKRDAVLDTRDLEHAELHGVNLTEMYKHSVLKRDDGDHITIWVDNSYASIEGPLEEAVNVSKRQSARLAGNSNYYYTGESNCRKHDMRFLTGKQSPFSGGALALARWGENHKGRWVFTNNNTWKTLAIGGSNAGHNAQYRADNLEKVYGADTSVGTYDMGYNARHTYDEYRREMEKGVWRAAGYGWMTFKGMIGVNMWYYDFPFNWELITSTATV
ncbi:hypothetical protein VE02_03316 [Pseudogymnoascus sp. 03VT05]|nr:hypothetical protein VE02_03316 [Pseudogymnoascus sp. 03VT05]